jgi:hypothetical protein
MASGRIPYAGRRNDPYQREIWQMMRAQMDADQRFYEGDRARSAAKWDAVGNLGEMIQGSYRGFKDREQAEADRDQAEADRVLDREEQQARIAESGRVAAREVRQDRRAADVEALASVSGLTLEQQQRLAHGQLESTPFVSAVDESGQFSIGRGATIPAESPSRPDLVRMGEGYGRLVRPVALGEEPVLTPAPTFEDINRFDIERANTAARVAAAEVASRERAAELTAEHRTLQEQNHAAAAIATAKFRAASIAAQESPSEASLRGLEESAITTVEAVFKGNALNPGRPSTFDLDGLKNDLRLSGLSESRIEGVIERAKSNVIQEQFNLGIDAWTAENTDAESAVTGMPAPVPDESVRAAIWGRASELVDPPDISPGHVPGSTPVPNLREIVEEGARPGGWGSLSIEDQVAEFQARAPEGYGLSREEAVALFREVDEAVTSIRETVEYERPRPMTRAESVSARPQPKPGEGYRSVYWRRQKAQTLGDLAAMAPVDEQNAKILSDAIDRYFSTLNP